MAKVKFSEMFLYVDKIANENYRDHIIASDHLTDDTVNDCEDLFEAVAEIQIANPNKKVVIDVLNLLMDNGVTSERGERTATDSELELIFDMEPDEYDRLMEDGTFEIADAYEMII